MSVETGALAAERGHVVGTLLSGGLRSRCTTPIASGRANLAGRPDPTAWPMPPSSASAHARGRAAPRRQIADYVRTAPVVAEPFTNPPGYNSIGANVAMLKAGPRAHRMVTDRKGMPIDHRTATVQQFMDTDTVFAGTPDEVFNQLKAFHTAWAASAICCSSARAATCRTRTPRRTSACSARRSRHGCGN